MIKTIFNDHNIYSYWRDHKLALADTKENLNRLIIEINNPLALSIHEHHEILAQIKRNNFVLYQLKHYQTKQPITLSQSQVLAINRQLGLVDYDQHLYANSKGLALISPSGQTDKQDFIPYTNQALNWHTDGYYNTPAQRIRTFVLFCANQANSGGQNAWIDHEILYILLREKDKKLASALIDAQAMTVPEHKVDGMVRRPISVGGVFFIDPLTKALMMRYTQRKQNVVWDNNPTLTQARLVLEQILNEKSSHHFELKMQSGQGIICHNIVHKRTGFAEQKTPRLMIRGRYFNRVK